MFVETKKYDWIMELNKIIFAQNISNKQKFFMAAYTHQ